MTLKHNTSRKNILLFLFKINLRVTSLMQRQKKKNWLIKPSLKRSELKEDKGTDYVVG